MKKMAVRKYYGHCYKPTREVGCTKIQEFIKRIWQVKIIAMNISVKKNRVGLYVYHLEGLRLPLLVCVPQFGNHCARELTRQKTKFTRTISKSKRLQTKTSEKEHVNMASQAKCESCFSKLMSWFSPSFSGALVNATALMLLLESFARKSDSVAAF